MLLKKALIIIFIYHALPRAHLKSQQEEVIMKSRSIISALSVLAALLLYGTAALAGGQEGSATGTRYGAFGLLDHRSSYGTFWFPEPFRIDELDVDNELRMDWIHKAKKGHVSDEVPVELEKSFGLTTVELETSYQRETLDTTDPSTGITSRDRTHGAGNIEISVRRPFYQFVSQDGFFDNTIGAALELGLPTNSPVSRNTEAVVKVFDALRLGQHFSLQTVGGYSLLMGPGDEGGDQTFEYGVVAGYNIPHKELPLPHVEEIIPIFELKGEHGLKGSAAGENDLSATVGVRANLGSIGSFQPRIGVGYVFPITQVARDDFRWGVVTSLVFEY